MRKIDLKTVSDKVRELFIDACENIPENLLTALRSARDGEESPLGKEVIDKIIENDLLAREKHLPLCQDTGAMVAVLCFWAIHVRVAVPKEESSESTVPGISVHAWVTRPR